MGFLERRDEARITYSQKSRQHAVAEGNMRKTGFYGFTIVAMIALLILARGYATAQTSPNAEASKMTTCPNCGMVLKEWAHTDHEFTNPEGSSRTCSILCVADMSLKSGTQPKDVQVALHLQPEKMIPAATAVYVIGSKDPGTMAQVSKLAFESKDAAEKFMGKREGRPAPSMTHWPPQQKSCQRPSP